MISKRDETDRQAKPNLYQGGVDNPLRLEGGAAKFAAFLKMLMIGQARLTWRRIIVSVNGPDCRNEDGF